MFNTNMTADEALQAYRKQILSDLEEARMWRDQWQARIDKLEAALTARQPA